MISSWLRDQEPQAVYAIVVRPKFVTLLESRIKNEKTYLVYTYDPSTPILLLLLFFSFVFLVLPAEVEPMTF